VDLHKARLMRLLRLEEDGGYRLEEYFGSGIPPYAILSHTWGADHDEVTFKDLQEDTGTEKAGRGKLAFCASRAAQDDLRFFWVDTCCIDKSSSAELSEAINSMFAWYRNSAKCYVYLSDVATSSFINEETLQPSRWFTRGWTLQELLAPRVVEFFSRDGTLIGNKSSPAIQLQITRISGISLQGLQGVPLSDISVKERMSWAKQRNTTREEDMAYCLLGIFDVHMPPIYGEGQEKALKRLQSEIGKADRGNTTVSGLEAAVQIVLAALSEKLEEKKGEDDEDEDIAAEDAWKAVTKRWMRKQRCCNCGSDDHLEYDCEEGCGRCKSITIHVQQQDANNTVRL
jgi:hypothetical protein